MIYPPTVSIEVKRAMDKAKDALISSAFRQCGKTNSTYWQLEAIKNIHLRPPSPSRKKARRAQRNGR